MNEPALPDLDTWFDARGWTSMPFQRTVWPAMARGESGLLHTTTDAGRTYAAWLGALQRLAQVRSRSDAPPLSVLWLTPVHALAADTTRVLTEAVQDLASHWTLGLRTGDTGSAEHAAQSRRLPTALVTIPESLSSLLARTDAREALGSVRAVVMDEWHELVSNKRGVQVQLAFARLRTWSPELIVWGLSTTLDNLSGVMDALGDAVTPTPGTLVQGHLPKRMEIDTLLPDGVSRFPWAGRLGMAMLPHVLGELGSASIALVFLSTRSQAELWYQAVINTRPEWAGLAALHHGSLDRVTRDWVEIGLKQGKPRAVFCTLSLDLDVGFLPVERVLQIGSPEGMARLLQRAGRSGHAPDRSSRVTVVPTHSLELMEGAAVRAAAMSGQVEARTSPHKPLNALVQHPVTVALGGGFVLDTLLQEVRRAWVYRDLHDDEWQWVLDFVRQGGHSLTAYPDYRRVMPDEHGI